MRQVAPVLLLSVSLFAQQQSTPQRSVHQNVLTSAQSPGIRIELPTAARYLGADRWTLYGVTDCELHVWIEADPGRVVNKLYWVQFEAFLPSKPALRYNYPFTRTRKIGDFDFDLRPRFGADSPPKPESDGAHVSKMVKEAGYTYPQDMMNVRFVHVPDEQKRTELMIIYVEDLKPTGFTAADLEAGGRGSDKWSALEQSLIERAVQRLKLSTPSTR